jgi:hypothetical protein
VNPAANTVPKYNNTPLSTIESLRIPEENKMPTIANTRPAKALVIAVATERSIGIINLAVLYS